MNKTYDDFSEDEIKLFNLLKEKSNMEKDQILGERDNKK